MYTIDKLTKAHGAAIERLGMTVRKELGTTPHGHRHAYGRRLKNGGVDPLLIQRCMHHVSEESQRVYTQATLQETFAALQDATRRIAERTAGVNVIKQTKEGWQPPPKT
ncbi:tyrosine-type recombinase/integrase [Serratia quinivorans]|uniref:tyrosine-type recombinase/integrase n=1 Tax=Serratia quinivorans TaxID=137545 RepID=UPI0021B75912|nr:tyrosine-type recombinase/integrase [Serratia quinivorans]